MFSAPLRWQFCLWRAVGLKMAPQCLDPAAPSWGQVAAAAVVFPQLGARLLVVRQVAAADRW